MHIYPFWVIKRLKLKGRIFKKVLDLEVIKNNK